MTDVGRGSAIPPEGDILENAYREATAVYMNAIVQEENPTFLKTLISVKNIKDAFSLQEAQELLGAGENIVRIPDIDVRNTYRRIGGKCSWYVNLISNFRDEKTELPAESVKLSDFSVVKIDVWNCVHCLREENEIVGNYLVDAYLVSYALCNSLVSIKHLMAEL